MIRITRGTDRADAHLLFRRRRLCILVARFLVELDS